MTTTAQVGHNICELDEIKATLSQLFSHEMEIEAVEQFPDGPQAVATYSTTEGHAEALCVCDLACGNVIGAALTMLGPTLVEESVQAGEMGETAFENLKEVFNITVALFTGGPRIALADVSMKKLNLNANVKIFDPARWTVTNLKISVDTYGQGFMSLIALKSGQSE